jgi:AcrR family transcriptional regulator
MPRVAAPQDVREAVLDAATRLMESHGFRKMTVDSIAQEARIGKATIYGYFKNKEDVALSVFRRHQEAVKERWRDLSEDDAPPEARVREMLLVLVLTGFDRAQRCRQSVDETMAVLRHVILQRRYQYYGEMAEHLADVLREGCDSGAFTCADVHAAAHALITGVSGLNPTNLSPQELGERDEIEARTRQVIDLMLGGLATRR